MGRLTGSMYRDLLAGLDGMTKDQTRAGAPPAAPIVFEVTFAARRGVEHVAAGCSRFLGTVEGTAPPPARVNSGDSKGSADGKSSAPRA